MKNNFKAIVFLIVSTAGLIGLNAAQAIAQPNQFLGRARLSPRENSLDYLRFSTCQTPPLQAIKLVAKKGIAEIDRVMVQFGNNQTERLQVRNRLDVGQETRWIDLKGGKRCLKAIAIVGSSEKINRNAVIEFYGR
jgi:Protein of unknown function (DUF2541)